MSAHKHQWVEESARGSTYVVCATCYLLPDGLLTIRERDEARAEVRRLKQEAKAIREVAAPLVHFVAMFDAMPLRGTADDFYGIHIGTPFEAVLRLSDLRKLAGHVANSTPKKRKSARRK